MYWMLCLTKRSGSWKIISKVDIILQERRNMFESIGKFLFGVGFGFLCGTVAVSLMTPKSGDQIRADIKNGIDEIKLDYELNRQKKQDELEAEIKQRWGE